MRARHGRTVEALADPVAGAAHPSSQVVLHGRGILGVDVEAEDLEVAVGDPRDRTGRDRRPPRVELGDEALEDVAELLVGAEREASFPDELRVAAAIAIRRGEAAGEGLQECVRARIVVARGDVDVLAPEELCERLRGRTGRRPSSR